MAIVHPCSHCGHTLSAPDEFAGKEVVCVKCEGRVRFPAATLDATDLLPASVEIGQRRTEASAADDATVYVRCDQCFQAYIVPASTVDLEFDCPKCQHAFRVPADALQPGRDAESGGLQNLKTAAATDAERLGGELLVELSAMDEAEEIGRRLQPRRRGTAWMPPRVRRAFSQTKQFAVRHAIGIAAAITGIVVWALVLSYVLR